jgi:hypothetical protein
VDIASHSGLSIKELSLRAWGTGNKQLQMLLLMGYYIMAGLPCGMTSPLKVLRDLCQPVHVCDTLFLFQMIKASERNYSQHCPQARTTQHSQRELFHIEKNLLMPSTQLTSRRLEIFFFLNFLFFKIN